MGPSAHYPAACCVGGVLWHVWAQLLHFSRAYRLRFTRSCIQYVQQVSCPWGLWNLCKIPDELNKKCITFILESVVFFPKSTWRADFWNIKRFLNNYSARPCKCCCLARTGAKLLSPPDDRAIRGQSATSRHASPAMAVAIRYASCYSVCHSQPATSTHLRLDCKGNRSFEACKLTKDDPKHFLEELERSRWYLGRKRQLEQFWGGKQETVTAWPLKASFPL